MNNDFITVHSADTTRKVCTLTIRKSSISCIQQPTSLQGCIIQIMGGTFLVFESYEDVLKMLNITNTIEKNV